MASKYERNHDDDDEDIGVIDSAKNIILKPVDVAFSKPARRAYLTTFLVICTAVILLGLAITAYTLFYWSYIPRIGFERTIFLQFDNVFSNSDSRFDSSGNPYGIVTLTPEVISAQPYDIYIELALPRTPENQDAGNFMLEASMYAAGTIVDPVKDSLVPGTAEADNRLALSRRPAILTYRSPIVESLYRLTELHWYILGWRREADSLKLSMFEGVEFARGWRNVPSTMRLEIQSSHRMQIYSAKAIFRARFRGLRWLMYNHRIISAFVFINSFWITELIFAGLAWTAISLYLQPTEAKAEQVHEVAEGVKKEDAGESKAMLSDTERTFPSSSRQQPLRYESPTIKQEEDDDAVVLREAGSKGTEADDEDEDADVVLDSGLGTSLESGPTRSDSVRRRRGRTSPEDEPR